MPPAGPGVFSAWLEAYLSDRRWALDARFNTPRIGRILMATGRAQRMWQLRQLSATPSLLNFGRGFALMKAYGPTEMKKPRREPWLV